MAGIVCLGGSGPSRPAPSSLEIAGAIDASPVDRIPDRWNGHGGNEAWLPTVAEAIMDIRDVPVDDLVLDPNLNLRDRLDDFTVERYADAWDRMPPVTVFEVEGRWL